jgi:hypothetical protein
MIAAGAFSSEDVLNVTFGSTAAPTGAPQGARGEDAGSFGGK